MKEQKQGDPETFAKIFAWCDRQERSRMQVEKKLQSWAVAEGERNQILDKLMEYQALNEERFAGAYARDAMRFKKWGRLKIISALIASGIHSSLAQKCTRELDQVEYIKILDEVIQTALQRGHKLNSYQHRMKLANYLLRKGFETELIFNRLPEQD